MKILDRLPIPVTETLAFVREESVRLKEAEIIVWVSVTGMTTEELPPVTARFPAILDTGHNHNFAIQEQHPIRWAGVQPQALPTLGHIRHSGQRMPLHAAKIWLHQNEPGKMTVGVRQFSLMLPRGVAVYPDSEGYPRLPLLGLRALLSNKLHLTIDGDRRLVNLRTPDWRTHLLQWLG